MDKQGASPMTPIKEAQIYGVVKTRLLQRKFAGPWIEGVVVCDIFCGDGINTVGDKIVLGSPLEIVRAIADSGIVDEKPTGFVASDIREDAVARLRSMVAVVDPAFPVECVTEAAAERIAGLGAWMEEHPKLHALLLVDPNGPGVLPFKELLGLAALFGKRLDVFINISETAVNRVLNHPVTKGKNWWADYVEFKDALCDLKRHYREGWCRGSISSDPQRWRFVCFWNYAPPRSDWAKQGLRAVKDDKDIESILRRP